MGTTKGRRIVDALDDLTAEVRLANTIAVLGMGVTALEHDDGSRAKTEAAKRRTSQRNDLRAVVREAFGMGES